MPPRRAIYQQSGQPTYSPPSSPPYAVCTSRPSSSSKDIVGYVSNQSSHRSSSDITLQFKGRVFRVPQLTGWLLVVSGDKLVEELRKAPETVLSAEGAQDEVRQCRSSPRPAETRPPSRFFEATIQWDLPFVKVDTIWGSCALRSTGISANYYLSWLTRLSQRFPRS